jgi:type I thyroxine 5'-deiodinase
MPANEREGIKFNQPKTDQERSEIATACASKLGLTIPCVVDGIDNKVGDTYGGWPDRLYIIDKDGKIAYKGAQGPGGFKVPEMVGKLEALTKK